MVWRLLSLRWGSSLCLLCGPLLLLLLLLWRLLLRWLPWPRTLWVSGLTLSALLALRSRTLLLLGLRLLLLRRSIGWLSWLGLRGLVVGRLTGCRAVWRLGLRVWRSWLPVLTWWLRGVALLRVGRTRAGLGLTGVRLLLGSSVRLGPVLTVVALVLMSITAWPLLSICHLLSIWHTSILHPHRVSLWAWGSIALRGVGSSLLGCRPSRSPWLRLRLLRVRVGPSVRLVPHLSYLVQGAHGLVSVRGLSSVSRAHRRRMVDPLLPTRMDPTILTAAHISWSLIGPVLIVIVSLWVICIAPSRAG